MADGAFREPISFLTDSGLFAARPHGRDTDIAMALALLKPLRHGVSSQPTAFAMLQGS